jgi:hypothetical protein
MAEETQELELSEAAQTLLDECRMVLPGIQALFGFQLVSVFSQRFTELSGDEQRIHLAAIALVALAVALVMTPATLHRHRGVREVTDTFIRVSSRLLLASMLPLAAGLSLDFALITRLILDRAGAAALAGAGVFAAMAFSWFVFPRLRGLHRLVAGARR